MSNLTQESCYVYFQHVNFVDEPLEKQQQKWQQNTEK